MLDMEKKDSEAEQQGEGWVKNRSGVILQSAKPLVKFCNSINTLVQSSGDKLPQIAKKTKNLENSNVWQRKIKKPVGCRVLEDLHEL
jgi:hypothetical protein